MSNALKVGDIVLVFDGNRRVYRRNEKGMSCGGPIYREHFRPTEIVGETSRSWVLLGGRKIPKSTLEGIYTEQQADDTSWVQEHRCRIADAVRFVTDAATMRQIAALAGYSDKVTI